jgi:hypothetical protein
MLLFLAGFFMGCVGTTFYKSLKESIPDFLKLNDFIKTTMSSKNSWWESTKIAVQIQYLKVTQFMYQTCIHLQKNVYELRFVIKGKLYKFIIKVPRGPRKVIRILDGEQDYTQDVTPFIEAHLSEFLLCPELLGRKTLFIEWHDGQTFTYSSREPIKLNAS